MGAVCVLLNSWWVPDEVTYGLRELRSNCINCEMKRLKGLDKFTELKKIVVGQSMTQMNEDFNSL